ncbi:MAG: hypothetical protein KJ042_12285, partial [Deltaproteobacteria bacterium]|nr:hypothetical protein [Deltaproteobacteria bacterium]
MPRSDSTRHRVLALRVAVCLVAAIALVAGACSKPRKEKRVTREIVVHGPAHESSPEADRLAAKAKSTADEKESRSLYEKALAIAPEHLAASAGLAKILADDPTSDPARVVELFARVAGANPS